MIVFCAGKTYTEQPNSISESFHRPSLDSIVTFLSEKELVAAFIPHLGSFLLQPGTFQYRFEVDFGGRIADIVLARFQNPPPSEKRLKPFRQVKQSDLFYMAQLVPRPLKAETLASRTWSDLNKVKEITRKMERHHLITRTESGMALAAGDWHCILPSEVVAFEAKLYDWRQAIIQAAVYAQKSDRSWVIMPDEQRENSELRKECKERGLGLAVLDQSGRIFKLVRPRATKNARDQINNMRLRLLWDMARPQKDEWFTS